ncbi:DUF5681 domain-containing protein [Sphingomonas changbaiensis]|nr:DUF5681 domain-containing protein [Sphingomonas changbaiensis]
MAKKKAPKSPTYRADNAGGYGNPPVKSQFRPGNSGGPGRRRGAKTLEESLRRLFRSKVPVTRNGQTRNMDMTEAMAERLKKEILTGNYKALELGVNLAHRYGPTGDENQVEMFNIAELTSEQKWALRAFLMTMSRADRHEVFSFVRQRDARRLRRD